MERNKVSKTILILALISIGVLTLLPNVQRVNATGTIYIRPDGSVDPPTAPIQRDGDLYTFTADISDNIVIQKDQVTIDGNDHKLQGSGTGNGFYIHSMHYVTIINTVIDGFGAGIYVLVSGYVNVKGNTLTSNGMAIEIVDSSNSNISNNNLSNNIQTGVRLEGAVQGSFIGNNSIEYSGFGINMVSTLEISHNTVMENSIAHNNIGLRMDNSGGGVYDNKIYHNNFIDNTQQVYIVPVLPGYYLSNYWNDTYPSGGNYWSDYTDVDSFSGPFQNQTGSDGIWDHPYIIAPNNIDKYPFTQQDGWKNQPPPVPEFPFGLYFEIALLPALIYLWWKRKDKASHSRSHSLIHHL